MKTNIPFTLLTAFLMLSIAGGLNAQSFTNGSFEAGITSHPNYGSAGEAYNAVPDGWELFSNTGGYGMLTSPDWWSTLGTPPEVVHEYWITDGNSGVALDSHAGDPGFQAGISQTVSGFNAGSDYHVTLDAGLFRLHSDLWAGGGGYLYGLPAVLDVYLDGSLYTSLAIANYVDALQTGITEEDFMYTMSGSMQEYGFSFTAGASSVDIGVRARIDPSANLEDFAGSGFISGSIMLDNFQFVTVPEPSGALLLGLTGMLGVLRRRRV